MRGKEHPTTPVMVVRADASVGWRLGEATTTPGLFVVADCAACDGASTMTRHTHRRWRVQTERGYLVGDLSLAVRQDAHAAAASLSELKVDWRDANLAVQTDPSLRAAAVKVLSRWGLARAAA